HRIEASHHLVARDLGEYRSCADAGAQCIPIDDRFEAALERQLRKGRTAIAIDLHVIRGDAQTDERATHGQIGRLKNVVRVDLLDVCPRDRPREGAAPDLARERHALLLVEHLRIAYASQALARIEDDSSRDHRPGERAATRLIDACRQPGSRKRQSEMDRMSAHVLPRELVASATPGVALFASYVFFTRSRIASAARALASRLSISCTEAKVCTSCSRSARSSWASTAGPSTSGRTSSLKYSGTTCRPTSKFGCAKNGALNSLRRLSRKLVSAPRRYATTMGRLRRSASKVAVPEASNTTSLAAITA